MSYSASSEFTDLVSAKLALIEDELGRQAGADTPFVTEAANHIISAGGKRFRPLLVVLCSQFCLLYTSPSPRDRQKSRMPSSA